MHQPTNRTKIGKPPSGRGSVNDALYRKQYEEAPMVIVVDGKVTPVGPTRTVMVGGGRE